MKAEKAVSYSMHRQRGELIGPYSKLHGPESIKNGHQGEVESPGICCQGFKKKIVCVHHTVAKERLKGTSYY